MDVDGGKDEANISSEMDTEDETKAKVEFKPGTYAVKKKKLKMFYPILVTCVI